ncbi:MAG: hypothetical protein KC656_24845, partial [Myxococcales bacterium]|nr:hypothetical protein [Myxococcales bacterium]
AARNADAPVVSDLVACGDAPGPHADANDATRGCFGADPDFHEIQGTLRIPHVQLGTPPFATRDDGGNADWSLGTPEIQRYDEVTFSVTVPRAPAPPEGWPIVLFAPDAGENYRTSVDRGLSARWTAIDHPAGTAGFAVVSLDTWLTGPRAGQVSPSWLGVFPPGGEEALLYDNPINPVAVRDNITQSAIDWFSMVRWLETVDWSTTSPAGAPLPIDPTRLWFVGQGLGGRAGTMVGAYEPAVKGVVLAGTGGLWSSSLSERTEPFDLAALMGPALGDPNVDRFQPIVAFGQQIVDRTDPVSHAPFVHRYADVDRDVLYVVSRDPEVGESSEHALARALYVEQVVDEGVPDLPYDRPATTPPSPSLKTAPVTANAQGSTAVAVLNSGADPHRLLYEESRTIAQVDAFMASGLLEGRATLPFFP